MSQTHSSPTSHAPCARARGCRAERDELDAAWREFTRARNEAFENVAAQFRPREAAYGARSEDLWARWERLRAPWRAWPDVAARSAALADISRRYRAARAPLDDEHRTLLRDQREAYAALVRPLEQAHAAAVAEIRERYKEPDA